MVRRGRTKNTGRKGQAGHPEPPMNDLVYRVPAQASDAVTREFQEREMSALAAKMSVAQHIELVMQTQSVGLKVYPWSPNVFEAVKAVRGIVDEYRDECMTLSRLRSALKRELQADEAREWATFLCQYSVEMTKMVHQLRQRMLVDAAIRKDGIDSVIRDIEQMVTSALEWTTHHVEDPDFNRLMESAMSVDEEPTVVEEATEVDLT